MASFVLFAGFLINVPAARNPCILNSKGHDNHRGPNERQLLSAEDEASFFLCDIPQSCEKRHHGDIDVNVCALNKHSS